MDLGLKLENILYNKLHFVNMVKFTANEIRDIIISMFAISIAFAYIFSGRDLSTVMSFLPLTIVAVGLAFLLHELAHKFVAIRFGYWAEYKMWNQGLILALIASYFGWVFAALGAVYIHGYHIKNAENGIISLAGPATNIILALLFLMAIPLASQYGLVSLAIIGAILNSFIAVFNLIPFAIFDGAKIFRWNPIIWVATMGLAVFIWLHSVGFNISSLL